MYLFVRGNKLADHYAGLASRSNGFSDDLSAKVTATTKLYAILIHGMGQVLAEWPTFGELGDLGRVRVGPHRAAPKPFNPHVPVWHLGRRRCNVFMFPTPGSKDWPLC